MTTTDRLAKIEELEAKATPGEWTVTRVAGDFGFTSFEITQLDIRLNGSRWHKMADSLDIGEDDAELIAHLRNECRWMVERLRKLEKVREITSAVIGDELDLSAPTLGNLNRIRAALKAVEECK